MFRKGYEPSFSTAVYTIHAIRNTSPVQYILKDFENKILPKGFYRAELTKVLNKDIYLIEKILKKKNKKMLVKFLGFDDKYNEWVREEDIL